MKLPSRQQSMGESTLWPSRKSSIKQYCLKFAQSAMLMTIIAIMKDDGCGTGEKRSLADSRGSYRLLTTDALVSLATWPVEISRDDRNCEHVTHTGVPRNFPERNLHDPGSFKLGERGLTGPVHEQWPNETDPRGRSTEQSSHFRS